MSAFGRNAIENSHNAWYLRLGCKSRSNDRLRLGCQSLAFCRGMNQTNDDARERYWFVSRYQVTRAIMLNAFAHATDIRCHDRNASCHSLKQRNGEALPQLPFVGGTYFDREWLTRRSHIVLHFPASTPRVPPPIPNGATSR